MPALIVCGDNQRSEYERRPHQAGIAGTASAVGKEGRGEGGERATPGTVSRSTLEDVLAEWSTIPRQVAEKTMEKYGLPNEATPSRLIWFAAGPWKRTIVYRDEVPHNFPKPHTDVLEQFIDYRVPPEKFDDIAHYDGSVVIERTKGEVSARCDMEEMNFLALNLMHDVATGKRTVEDARRTYADTAVAFMMKRPAAYTERLQFEVPRGGTADLDETMISGAMLKQMGEKVKDLVGSGGSDPSRR
ncbi:MAG: hypothetical protein ACT443_13710 [Gemmatimonadota bacterium]